MRYLRTYEKYFNSKDIKKYIVWGDFSSFEIELLEVARIENDENIVWVNVLYLYNESKNELIKVTDKSNQYLELDDVKDSSYILYVSDSLDDCKNFIEMKMSAKKYNL